MRKAEKALREAGWEEIPRNGAHVGDEVYDLEEHEVFVVDAPASPSCNWTVLRAPRPEPEYEHGTVARVKLSATGREFNAIWGPSNSWDAGFGYLVGDVEVLRVIAYPDGTTPESRSLDEQYRNGYAQGFGDGRFASCLDRDALIEGMVPRVAEHWYSELRISKYFRPNVTTPPKWAEADDAIRESWKREARNVLREAYEEATK